MCSRLLTFGEKNNQFGFRRGHSIEHAIDSIVDKLKRAIIDDKDALVVYS